jgi:glycosyltransferase involved in cell wall biosynthesis
MKIGIDATFTPNGGSLGHLQEFIKEFSKSYSKTNMILYLKKENLNIIDNDVLDRCSIKIVTIASYGNIFRVLWGQFILPVIARMENLSILFCPGNISPMIRTTPIKSQWIATIGPFSKDVYFGLSLSEKLLMVINKYFILFSGYTSNVVIHESRYSQNLFEDKYKYNKDNQYLIECGKDNFYHYVSEKPLSDNVITNISKNDLLCVSHLYPYKNIERLILAFCSKRSDRDDQKLYIAGKKAFPDYFASLEKLVCDHDLEKRIIFTGMVNKNELRYAYSRCKLFVFPSLCESSGYTLIEAMSCGSPILASDRTAIPYTCNNAAEYFDAYSKDDLQKKLQNLLSDPDKLLNMKKKSISRSEEMIDYKAATNQFIEIVNKK